MSDGFIRLNRKFFTNVYWSQQRTFSLSEAWLDLIQMARFDAEPATKELLNGRQITIKRGEIHAGLRFLSDRWGWSVEKTQRYINKHIKKHEIERRTEHGESILKLCNYNTYNPPMNTNPYTVCDTNPYTNPYTGRTPTRTNNKKDKEREEKEENITPDGVVELWNSTCRSFPKVERLTDSRKRKINTRLSEFGQTHEDQHRHLTDLFSRVEASAFLRGDNKQNWRATFDWLFANDKNWVKVMEGNYDSKNSHPTGYNPVNDIPA